MYVHINEHVHVHVRLQEHVHVHEHIDVHAHAGNRRERSGEVAMCAYIANLRLDSSQDSLKGDWVTSKIINISYIESLI